MVETVFITSSKDCSSSSTLSTVALGEPGASVWPVLAPRVALGVVPFFVFLVGLSMAPNFRRIMPIAPHLCVSNPSDEE